MYLANENRYGEMQYIRCGKSGLKLPRVSLGFWHNFGSVDSFENQKKLVYTAFDRGITHFDLANNYGPIPGSAEENLGRILEKDLKPYRDELIISSKAGYDMWPGPYGNGGSRKYLISSLDQSLKRMKLDYVDIFYHHRPDPETPMEESLGAISDMVKQGKVLYVGISNYRTEDTKKAIKILEENKTPLLIHQPKYNMFNRWVEDEGLLDVLNDNGVGSICFSPLAQGMLTDRYLNGIPADSRAARNHFLKPAALTPEVLAKVEKLNEIAKERNQTLAQMALVWTLRQNRVTSAVIGASKVEQLNDNIDALKNMEFTEEELDKIEAVLRD